LKASLTDRSLYEDTYAYWNTASYDFHINIGISSKPIKPTSRSSTKNNIDVDYS